MKMCKTPGIRTIEDGEVQRPMQFEDALTFAGFGKFNVLLIFITGLVLSGVFLETLGLSFVLPVAQCDLNLTTEQRGFLSSISMIGIISTSHLWGYLADTFGRRRVVLPTLLLSFTCTFISSFANNFWVMNLLRFFSGVFISGSAATIYAYLSEFHNLKNRSRAILGATVVFGGGCISMPTLAWIIINNDWQFNIPFLEIVFKPWRLYLIACGLPSLMCGLTLLGLPESPKFLLLDGKQNEAIDVIKRVYHYNGGRKEADIKIIAIVDENSTVSKHLRRENLKSFSKICISMWKQTAPLFKDKYKKPTLIFLTMQFGIFILSNGVCMWFPDILDRIADFEDKFPGNETTLCQILSATGFGSTKVQNDPDLGQICSQKLDITAYQHSILLESFYAIGFLITGLVMSTFGKLPIMLFVLLITALTGFALTYTTTHILSIYFLTALILCGLALPLLNAAIVEIYPTNLRAMAVCIALMAGRLGGIVGTNLVGVLLKHYCTLTFVLFGFNLLICAVLACFIPNIVRRVGKKLIFP